MPPWIREKGSFVVVDFLMRKANEISSHSLTEKKRRGKKTTDNQKTRSVIILLRNREFMSGEPFTVDTHC